MVAGGRYQEESAIRRVRVRDRSAAGGDPLPPGNQPRKARKGGGMDSSLEDVDFHYVVTTYLQTVLLIVTVILLVVLVRRGRK